MENRVTTKRIREVIHEIEYFNNGKTTVCIVELINGFQVVGTSACVIKEDFDEEIGKEWAFRDVVSKIEELEAYRVQWELCGTPKGGGPKLII